MGFLIRVLMNALAIYFAAAIVPGIELRGYPETWVGKRVDLLTS
jgi:hypothetical protein